LACAPAIGISVPTISSPGTARTAGSAVSVAATVPGRAATLTAIPGRAATAVITRFGDGGNVHRMEIEPVTEIELEPDRASKGDRGRRDE
jgi:hypothetical protein